MSDIWFSVNEYKDLVNLNVKFIKGELSQTPYHLGPLDSETLPLVEKLIKMHARGILTLEGQPGICEYKQFIPHTWIQNGQIEGNWYVDCEQKSYISFCVQKTNESLKFIRKILTSKELVVFALDISNNKVFSNTKGEFNVTRERSHSELDKLESTQWTLFTNIHELHSSDIIRIWNDYPQIQKILKKCFHVYVALKEYGVSGIEDKIMSIYSEFQNM